LLIGSSSSGGSSSGSSSSGSRSSGQPRAEYVCDAWCDAMQVRWLPRKPEWGPETPGGQDARCDL